MKKVYRITFSGNGKSKHIDVCAESCDDAFSRAYRMPEASSRTYKEVTVEEIPSGLSVIGIEFEYTDTFIKRNFHDCLFIKANNEDEAIQYYNDHYKGKRFWFNAGKTEEDGKCIRGKVIDTYFAAGPRYDADATEVSSNN